MANWWDQLTGYWLSDREDRQSLIAGATPMPDFSGTFSAPPEVDPRKLFPDHPWPESQGQQGACAGHARANISEWCAAIASGVQPPQLSRQMAYISGQMQDGLVGRDCGSTINGQVRVATEKGTCLESIWPYTGRYVTQPPAPHTWDEIWESAQQYRIRNHAIMRSYNDVFNWIASGTGGVDIGIAWTLPDAGVIESYRGGRGGGHSVALLGYTQRRDSRGRQYLLLLNSWGVRWGNSGWAEVAPAAIEGMLRDNQTVMAGLSDMVNIKPRKIEFTSGKSMDAAEKAAERFRQKGIVL